MTDFEKQLADATIKTCFDLLFSQGVYLQSGVLVFGTEPSERSCLDVYFGVEND